MDAAQLDEVMRRNDVAWLGDPGRTPRAVWHLWHEGAMYVVTGGAEQDVPLGAEVEVSVRDRERPFERAATWPADVSEIHVGSELWEEVVPLLHARRLNAPDGEEQPARWARESRVLRLVPVP